MSSSEYNPDSDCGIQFNLSIDILILIFCHSSYTRELQEKVTSILMTIGGLCTTILGLPCYNKISVLLLVMCQYHQNRLFCMFG